jgi:formylglycine-generating enzyme required for sulfatase activity
MTSLDLNFVPIMHGSYVMGSVSTFDKSVVPVDMTISNDFYLSSTLVTQELWLSVMDTKPWEIRGIGSKFVTPSGARYPAVWISYLEALEFCGVLSTRLNAPITLPTEAQWEYACRAGSPHRFFWGEDVESSSDYAWFSRDKKFSSLSLKEVARLKPNKWGLYDMLGLCEEWVLGDYSQDVDAPWVRQGTYPNKAIDFLAIGGDAAMIRGGSFMSFGTTCDMKALRGQDDRYLDIGFRIASSTKKSPL